MSPRRPSSPTVRAKRRALRDEVYDALLEMLIDGQLSAGESLGIDPIAEQLGVSPTPVREALVQLEATGLVDRTALRGYKVAPPMSRQVMEELFEARLLIEVEAARRAMERRDTLVQQLRQVQQRQRGLATALTTPPGRDAPLEELTAYLKADWAFHEAIFEATGNRFIVEMARHISTHGQRLRQFVERHRIDADVAVEEHERILTALESGDEDEVVEAMRAHIEAVRQRALQDAESSEPGR